MQQINPVMSRWATLEMVPEAGPIALRAGDEFLVRLLQHDQALANLPRGLLREKKKHA